MNPLPLWNDAITHNMIWLQDAVSVAEKMLRVMIVYVFLVVTLRIFGKRELAQLNPFDLVVLLLLSNTVQNAIIGRDDSVSGGLVGAMTLLVTNYFVVRYVFRHRRLDQLLAGTPTVLIEDGRVNPKALARELLNESELITAAHRQGFASLDEVERCVLEPGGTFFMARKQPPVAEVRQAEVLALLDQLSRQIEDLRRQKG